MKIIRNVLGNLLRWNSKCWLLFWRTVIDTKDNSLSFHTQYQVVNSVKWVIHFVQSSSESLVTHYHLMRLQLIHELESFDIFSFEETAFIGILRNVTLFFGRYPVFSSVTLRHVTLMAIFSWLFFRVTIGDRNILEDGFQQRHQASLV